MFAFEHRDFLHSAEVIWLAGWRAFPFLLGVLVSHSCPTSRGAENLTNALTATSLITTKWS
jgi:hypothetical protein